jgi:hypothetical protein
MHLTCPKGLQKPSKIAVRDCTLSGKHDAFGQGCGFAACFIGTDCVRFCTCDLGEPLLNQNFWFMILCSCPAASAVTAAALITIRSLALSDKTKRLLCNQVHLKDTDIKSLDALHVGASYDYRISDAVKVGGTYQRNELYIFPKVRAQTKLPSRHRFGAAFVTSNVPPR